MFIRFETTATQRWMQSKIEAKFRILHAHEIKGGIGSLPNLS